MSTFIERINADNTNEIHLETGFDSFGSRKLPKNETFFISSIPIDRHRFDHFSRNLGNFTLNVNSIFVNSCNTDCKRKLNYTHGKNVSLSDDLYDLCTKRCDLTNKNSQAELKVIYLFIS